MATNVIQFPRRAANDNELAPFPATDQRLAAPAQLYRVLDLRRAA